MRDNDPGPKAPAPVSLRLTPDAAAALDALTTATGGKVPRHRLMLAALTHGARALAADPRALVPLLDVGGVLGALGLAVAPAPSAPPAVAPATPVVQPATPVHNGSAPVAARSAPVHRAATPATPPAPGKARPAARGDASAAEVDAMLRALRAAVDRGASINALATAAGMTGGGTRRRLAALLAGERPAVSAELARVITSAAEKHGR